ncbi:NAD-dependent protein deacetylase sirtuin-3, mitochondrial-like isoform X2 [Oratosquilla oratoria]|uniref:NAD-dependent protein deacetylase sirtuin-3, mitochondrial-like isoform X2 n=1 Tax=Oratosquilla oratoria TaxID=337810 RepID=UPI003F774CF6
MMIKSLLQIHKGVKRLNPIIGHGKLLRLFSNSAIRWKSREEDNVDKVVELVRSKTNILVMTGAGISTPSGIPDFRSPGSGLYHNLKKFNLPYAEAIFDIQYFMMDPKPFFTLAQELFPGVNYKPNAAHYFLRLLQDEEKLQMLYTQNIDGLERLAGIDGQKLVESHGTFSTASCTLCSERHDSEQVKNAILVGKVPIYCSRKKCKGKVKPDIVFFGENLPWHFWNYQNQVPFTDLLIVIGTSLEVYPFAAIADAVNYSTPRILINRNTVGSFGLRPNDHTLSGDLLETTMAIVKGLGWTAKLEKLMACSRNEE